jgi:hypothetical protein
MSNNVLINVPVQSVNGKTGTVVLDASNVGAAEETHTHTESDITDLQSYLTDADSDGNLYARQDGAWVEVADTTGIADAESNGYPYIRKDEGWVRPAIVSSGISSTTIGIKIEDADASDSYSIPSATTTTAGLMSATDKTKLDGLENLESTDDLAEGDTNLYYTDDRVAASAAVVLNTAKVSFDDADSDGLTYGRQDGEWVELDIDSSDTTNEYITEYSISVPTTVTTWDEVLDLLPESGNLNNEYYLLSFDGTYDYTFSEPMDFSKFYNGSIRVGQSGSGGVININISDSSYYGFVYAPYRDASIMLNIDVVATGTISSRIPFILAFSKIADIASKDVNIHLRSCDISYINTTASSGTFTLIYGSNLLGDITISYTSITTTTDITCRAVYFGTSNYQTLIKGVSNIIIYGNSASSGVVTSVFDGSGYQNIIYYYSNTNFPDTFSSDTYRIVVTPD